MTLSTPVRLSVAGIVLSVCLVVSCQTPPRAPDVHLDSVLNADSDLPKCEPKYILEPNTCIVACYGNQKKMQTHVCSGGAGAGEIFRPDNVSECTWSSPWSEDLWVHMSKNKPNRWSKLMGYEHVAVPHLSFRELAFDTYDTERLTEMSEMATANQDRQKAQIYSFGYNDNVLDKGREPTTKCDLEI